MSSSTVDTVTTCNTTVTSRLTSVERQTTVCVEVVVYYCRLDWQRPPGEEVYHPDPILTYQPQEANLQLCLSRLHGRPLEERKSLCYWDWDMEVEMMNDELDKTQEYIQVINSVSEVLAGFRENQAKLDRLTSRRTES